MLKFLKEFAEAIFLGIVKLSLLDGTNVLSGQTTDQTRVRAQQVHNTWSDCWIVVKLLEEFLEAVFLGVAMESLLNAPSVSSGQTTDQTRVTGQKVYNSWSDRWIVLKFS